jgi:signal transduction histidine kinase
MQMWVDVYLQRFTIRWEGFGLNALMLGLDWLNVVIWWMVFGYYRKKRMSLGIRPLEATFAGGVTFVLACYLTICALFSTGEAGYLPASWMSILNGAGLHALTRGLTLGMGTIVLLRLVDRIAALDQQVSVSSLHERYRHMIDADPRAILVFSPDRRLTEINRNGRAWMRGDSLELTGLTVEELIARVHPDDPQGVLTRIIGREPLELKWMGRMYSDFEWTDLIDEKGQAVGYMLCFRDVTEEKKFQRELIHSEKLAVVGQLAAAMAHEIRNPLTSIKGFLQLLEHRLEGSQHAQTIRDYTKIMVEEVDRMEKIIRDFLLMTKPSDVTRERACVNQLIKRMLILVENQATLRGVSVVTDLRSISHVLMHREAIQQVILNLLQNAFEAMNSGGTLTLKTMEEEEFVAIQVIDTGIGMSEEVIANLGSPFYSTKTEGTGLGLTVSSKIIKEHNGYLDVSSVEGEGTTITLRLPKT